jgi:tetratricopeptide (TPR) repeat protein
LEQETSKFQESIETLTEYLNLDQDNHIVWFVFIYNDNRNKIAISLISLQKFDEANEILDFLLENKYNSIETILNKGIVLRNLSRFEESVQYFDQVLKLEPNNKFALKLLEYVKSKIK